MIYKYCKPHTFLLLCEFPGLVLHLFVHELVNEHEHLAPAGPQGVGGPGDASAVRWAGLGGKNVGQTHSFLFFRLKRLLYI